MADTITLKDGKWNLSKFQVYEYVTSNKSLVKIAEDKSISDVVIADAKMEVGEVYVENTKENIEKYNKNEYAFMYVKTDKFYYGYVMKNMLEYLGGDFEIPPDVEEPEEPANPGIEYEKTIKSQTEYAEANNFKLSKAFAEINTELEKDDNLIASNLFDVDRCIEDLKKSRKKWATGNIGATQVNNVILNTSKMNLYFTPKLILYKLKTTESDFEGMAVVGETYTQHVISFGFTQSVFRKATFRNGVNNEMCNWAGKLDAEITWYAFE